MKLPDSTEISVKKIKDYLLTWQARNDKSQYLERAGYKKENWEQLASDIREQLLPIEAVFEEKTIHGDIYSIRGTLLGPNGNELKVKSVWTKDALNNKFRFISLMPERRNRL